MKAAEKESAVIRGEAASHSEKKQLTSSAAAPRVRK